MGTGPSDPYIVVGSGPAGVACARALVDAGKQVTIIDTGLTLEDDRRERVANVATRAPEEWTAQDLAAIRGHAQDKGEVPLKLSYGSDYPYRTVPASTPVIAPAVTACGSYAAGGLSNVWGGSVLPYRQQDLAGWPIGEKDLAPSYAAVLKFMAVASVHDDLERILPLYNDRPVPHAESRQAARLMRKLDRNREALNRKGVLFGRSRIALDAAGVGAARACATCGLCLSGCPYDLIYSARSTLADLRKHAGVRYLPGLTVKTVSESADGVRIAAIDLNGATHDFTAGRVFLASGVINTAAIVLRSLGQYDRPVAIRDSQYYLLPALSRRSFANVSSERLHTLAQLFFEIIDPDISPYTVHLQFYTYNDLFRDLLAAKLGVLDRLVPEWLILGRLMLFQGYLHSDHSGSIRAKLKRQGSGDVLTLDPVLNPETVPKVAKVAHKIGGLMRQTDLFPVRAMMEVTEPGRGFHIGASFPMADDPAPGQSDRWGRPHGMRRTHIVDASIFSTIPATTITFSAMANAHRIGSAVARGEMESAHGR
jgi:choline dehydrogenase-like flavoprotein